MLATSSAGATSETLNGYTLSCVYSTNACSSRHWLQLVLAAVAIERCIVQSSRLLHSAVSSRLTAVHHRLVQPRHHCSATTASSACPQHILGSQPT